MGSQSNCKTRVGRDLRCPAQQPVSMLPAVLLRVEVWAKYPQQASHLYNAEILQMLSEKFIKFALQEIYIDVNVFYYLAYSYEYIKINRIVYA